MPWFKIKVGRFGIGRDAGPPPSYRLTFLRIVWKDWDAWAAVAQAEIARFRTLLDEARKELKK